MKYVPRTLGVFVLCLLAALGVGGCDGSGANPGAPPEPPAGEWRFLGLEGEHVSDVTSIAVHPQDPDVIYTGSAFDFSAGLSHRRVQDVAIGSAGERLYAGLEPSYVGDDKHGLYVHALTK